MHINLVGAFIRNYPFGTEIAFKKGFERLGGHSVCAIDPDYPDQTWDYDAHATVIFKWLEGKYINDLQRCNGKKIVYQPDDLRFSHIKNMMQEMRKYCDYAFTFDDDGAKLAIQYGYATAMPLLLTADDELYVKIPGRKKDIDVSFIGSMTYGENHKSRRRMVEILKEARFRVLAASDVYDIRKIVEIYNRSKIVLNHATDVGQPFGMGYGYQCRHFEAGMTSACILSNTVCNDRSLKNFVEFSNENDLIDKTRWLLNDDEVRERYAVDIYDEIRSAHLPQHRAAQMIEFIERL